MIDSRLDPVGRLTAPPQPTGGFRFVDLFAGAGGFTLGLTRAGGTQAGVAVEADTDCAETLRTNFPLVDVICDDIRNVEYSFPVDVVAAGPPCQGFSTLN